MRVVIKLGGHAMDNGTLLDAFCEDIASLSAENIEIVIVHGGGPQINSLLERLKIESHFINGLRVTDDAALAAVEMALCGEVNKAVTRRILKAGANAAGISGEDGKLLVAEIKNPDLGKVGTVTAVNPEILESLLAGGFTPVVAPLAISAEYEALNVNADTAAGAIAGALSADQFLLISDVPGVLDKGGRLIPELSGQDIERLKCDGTISGGMIPKVECCSHALAKGAKSAIILDGKQAHSVSALLRDRKIKGTVIA